VRTTLLFLAIAISLRIGLFYAGVALPGFTFGFVLLGFVVIIAFLAGYFELQSEPNTPMPALFRVGLRSTVLFALVYALFSYAFFKLINTQEFPERIEAMVREAVSGGNPEAAVRERLNAFFNPGKYAFMTFIGLFALGAVNALFFAIVHHKLLRRYRS
jgi:hypothetical protein